MHEEATDELIVRERHHFLVIATLGAVIFVFERYSLLIELDQSAVGDGDTMGIARKILEYCSRTSEGSSSIDIPVEVLQGIEPFLESGYISKIRDVAEEV